ncbi:MAG: hypothetical protein EOP51_07860 [Sphingobacteriales bacterium]|nr:MAG: hypothetical protein EOP51_07860 [Sphingobacteriales bacterium]
MHIFAFTASAETGLDVDGYDVEVDGGTVISNSGDYEIPQQERIVTMFPEHHHNKKFQTNKHITFETVLPQIKLPVDTAIYCSKEQSIVIPEEYAYLFFEEINPPPPKAALA